MTLKKARQYRLASRLVLPLGALYGAGFAIGDLLYRATGHLGLLRGPLGDLYRVVLSTPRNHGWVSCDRWAMLVPLAIWLAVLAVELRHQRRKRLQKRGVMLLTGYCLGAISMIPPLIGSRQGGPFLGGTLSMDLLGVSAVVLATSLWLDWSVATRIAALVLCSTGILVSLWVLRSEDRARLGQEWPAAYSHRTASVPRGSRTRA